MSKSKADCILKFKVVNTSKIFHFLLFVILKLNSINTYYNYPFSKNIKIDFQQLFLSKILDKLKYTESVYFSFNKIQLCNVYQ